jgi:hypothetical protein
VLPPELVDFIIAATALEMIGVGGIGMTFHRVLVLAAVLALPFVGPAAAQFGGYPAMPGASGEPGIPGTPGYGPPAGQPPTPPACQRLMALKEEAQKNGLAVQVAGKRKATAQEVCRLFSTFATAETNFVRGLEENKAECGAPDEVVKRVKAESEQVAQIRKQVCEVAANGLRNTGPRLPAPYDPLHDPFPRLDID